jgi:tetratricopeptide (TPR) repeat protein
VGILRLSIGLLAAAPIAAPGPTALFDQALAAAEARLRAGRASEAETAYRPALVEGWRLIGTLDLVEGRDGPALEALGEAAALGADARTSRLLAIAHLHAGETEPAIDLLRGVVSASPTDVSLRRLLAQALVAAGRPEEAVRELEQARAAAPRDLELAFALGAGHLRLKNLAAADRLLAEVARGHPTARARVLIGRTYLEYEQFERARKELHAALQMDPRVPRAHYYLGMAAISESGVAQAADAAAEFQAELRTVPHDLLSQLQLGMALVEARRPAEALPWLEAASRVEPPLARAFYYLGRAQLALDRPADSVATFTRALELAQSQQANETQLGAIHIQLGQALRALERGEEAAPHFAEAERLSARGNEAVRERLARYLSDTPEPGMGTNVAASIVASTAVAALAPAARGELRQAVKSGMAHAYLNLGVVKAQARDFEGAAARFEKAAALDPQLPQVDYSLGVARFNARQFEPAIAPLERAVMQKPDDIEVRRLLALSYLEARAYDKAATLLAKDPNVERDPSLRFAYAMALVRSGATAQAQAIFTRLLAEQGQSAEVNVLLGQAQASDGDFESAVRSLDRALQIDPHVAEAHSTQGVIYLKQGRLDEAEKALRAELADHPNDWQAQQNLSVVLDSRQRPDEALLLLRKILGVRPEFADARYLLGKILLAQGAVEEAVQELEAATRLAPDNPSACYQLGKAYQRLGRSEDAERQFELFRNLKAKR